MRGRSRANPSYQHHNGHCNHISNIVDVASKAKSAASWPAACLLSNSYNTYCTSRRICTICTKVPRNHVFASRTYLSWNIRPNQGQIHTHIWARLSRNKTTRGTAYWQFHTLCIWSLTKLLQTRLKSPFSYIYHTIIYVNAILHCQNLNFSKLFGLEDEKMSKMQEIDNLVLFSPNA